MMQTLRDVKEQAKRNLKRIWESGGHDALAERDLRVMAAIRAAIEEILTPQGLALHDARQQNRRE
jgi:hypothetical protein